MFKQLLDLQPMAPTMVITSPIWPLMVFYLLVILDFTIPA